MTGAEGQAITWSTADELEGAVSTCPGAEIATPLTAADIPLVPDVVRALRRYEINDLELKLLV